MLVGENIFTLEKYIINCSFSKEFELIPFGDIHYDSPLCARDRFSEFCKEHAGKENAIYLGMGDYFDLTSYNERKILAGGLHESTLQTLDELYDRYVNELYKKISFMQGRIIGLIEGNHYGAYMNGMTTTQKLCGLLKCKYLGISSFIRLVFRRCGTAQAVDVFAHHGKGGAGRMVGSDLNHIQAMSEISDAQINLQGHTHKKSMAMKTRLSLTEGGGNLTVTHKKIIFGRTGSFLKGWEPNAPSYVVRACMNPTDIGVIKIKMKLVRKRELRDGKRKDTDYLDLHGSI